MFLAKPFFVLQNPRAVTAGEDTAEVANVDLWRCDNSNTYIKFLTAKINRVGPGVRFVLSGQGINIVFESDIQVSEKYVTWHGNLPVPLGTTVRVQFRGPQIVAADTVAAFGVLNG